MSDGLVAATEDAIGEQSFVPGVPSMHLILLLLRSLKERP